MKAKVIALLILTLNILAMPSHAAIGDWHAYMAYHDVQEIEQAGNQIFVKASNCLYVYNQNDQSIQTFSKTDYLSDCDIQHIAYNKAAKRLLILYSNNNIDLMNASNYEVANLSDYYTASTIGDKTVNDIHMNGNYAYLSNGFGIIKVNVSDGEISETYNLGFKVDWCEIKDNNIYAYSSQQQGKYCASLSANLLDKSNWKKIGEYVAKTQEDKSELQQLVSKLNPGGPKYNNFWYMQFANNQLYTCGGGFGHGIDTTRPGNIQVLNNKEWTIYDDNITLKTGMSYVDINSLAIDPNDNNHVFAGSRNGLYEFQEGKFINYYNNKNSLITSFMEDPEYQLVLTTMFDHSGNLWLLNSQSYHSQSLIEYTKDKEWVSHHRQELTETIGNNKPTWGSMQYLMEDSRNLIWFVNNHWITPAVVCYQPTTDAMNIYKTFTNQDGTSVDVTFVRYVTEDKDHNLWIATNVGPLLLPASEIDNESPIFTQIKVPRNDGTNYADYLLNNVDISWITIDDANRKWLGTNGNGVYLISADNLEQIHHFTSSNSPLLSDNIESMAIDSNSGEIFFGTDKGLCSYMSDATAPQEEMTKDNVWAYPNPVRPDYTGPITITGLSFEADVKITTSNGILVNQGKSHGGTYTWDRSDLKGRKVASGIYMVQTATNEGNKGTVCKIAIIK